MSSPIKTYDNEQGLLLNIASNNLKDVELRAFEPLWEIMVKSKALGVFTAFIEAKKVGVSGKGPQIKVMGLAQGLGSVAIKTQSKSEFCYLCRLIGRTPTNGHPIPPSMINERLKSVAGNDWFDPYVEESEGSSQPTPPKQRRTEFATIGDAMRASEEKPAEVLAEASEDSESDTPLAEESAEKPEAPETQRIYKRVGLAKNRDLTKEIFMTLITSHPDGLVSCDEIIKVLIEKGVCSVPKGSGPILNSLVRKCWLERVQRGEYRITGIAEAEFCGKSEQDSKGERNGQVDEDSLSEQSGQVSHCGQDSQRDQSGQEDKKEESPTKVISQPRTPEPLPRPELMSKPEPKPELQIDKKALVNAFDVLADKAQQYDVVRKQADCLELRIMEIEEQIAPLQTELLKSKEELEKLKPILGNAEFHKAWQMISDLSGYISAGKL